MTRLTVIELIAYFLNRTRARFLLMLNQLPEVIKTGTRDSLGLSLMHFSLWVINRRDWKNIHTLKILHVWFFTDGERNLQI